MGSVIGLDKILAPVTEATVAKYRSQAAEGKITGVDTADSVSCECNSRAVVSPFPERTENADTSRAC